MDTKSIQDQLAQLANERDWDQFHSPKNLSMALAGGGIRAGQVVGETDPTGARIPYDSGTPIADIHATILHALGIGYETMLDTPVGRPIAISKGNAIDALLDV